MPLDGSDVASKPAGTTASPNTTIESSKFNSVVNDIYSIFNSVRTLAKGFTGASTAIGALDNFNTVSGDIASASTTDLSTATGIAVTITGTATIAGFGTCDAGVYRVLTFEDALTITHGDNIVLPGDEDLVVAAGDIVTMRSEGSGVWHLENYQPKAPFGTSATKDVGTTTGTVAAGDDSRITGATQAADLASTSSSKGASLVGIQDAGGLITATTVEAALAELAARVKQTQGTTKSLSGTTTDITDVPAGVKKIELWINGMSTATGDVPGIRLGTSGGVVSTGYVGTNAIHGSGGSSCKTTIYGTGLWMWGDNDDAANVFFGVATLYRVATNTWVMASTLAHDSGFVGEGAGKIALSGELTKIEFCCVSSASFDGGSVVPVYYG
jgi:hypothetical protein